MKITHTVLFILLLATIQLNSTKLSAQTSVTIDSIRIINLPDARVESSASDILVSSGEIRNNSWHIIAPGGGYAILFSAPKADYHSLRSLTIHLKDPKKIKQGNIQVRIASINKDGSPSEDDALPVKILLKYIDLQKSSQFISFEWPEAKLLVPDKGFFIVIEGVGETKDEYVSEVVPGKKRGNFQYKIQRRQNHILGSRTVNPDELPTLKGGNVTNNSFESWYRDTVTQQWKRHQLGKSTIVVEALFKL